MSQFTLKAEHLLAISVDSLIEAVHFPPETSPDLVGYKSLSVNLSDMAAMGAEPLAVTLDIRQPQDNPHWLDSFLTGFNQLRNEYQLKLLEFTQGAGQRRISIQIHGQVPAGEALRRDGAKSGDKIYVTGTLGDAGLALAHLQSKHCIKASAIQYFLSRLNTPEARVNLGIKLRNIATSAIDISDGLSADLNHILKASGCGADIFTEKLPVSDFLKKEVSEETGWELALSSGDDYEICFTAKPSQSENIKLISEQNHCPITEIGIVTNHTNLNIFTADLNNFKELPAYEHFKLKH